VLDYLARAAAAWFVGFFPLAEIYVAVPAAMAAGLDDVSVVFWASFGNVTPLFLVHWGYERLRRYERADRLLARFVRERARRLLDRHGAWLVLLLTPWIGVWVVAVTAKALGMGSRRLLLAASASIVAYAVALVVLIRLGLAAAGG
jgi:hypothetical protein